MGSEHGGSRLGDRRSLLDDPEDFSVFYDTHAEPVLIWFTRRVFEPETAVDLTAEVFAQAYASRRRFRGSTVQEAGGWVFAIARHVLSHFIRKGQAERRAIDRLGIQTPSVTEEDHHDILERAGVADLRSLVREQLLTLSDDQRVALQLRVVDDLSYPRIARQLGITEQTVRARVSRGLRALAVAVDSADPERAIV